MPVNSKKQFFHAKIVIVVGDDSSLVVFPRKTRNLAGLREPSRRPFREYRSICV
jgi:hypothetical protein